MKGLKAENEQKLKKLKKEIHMLQKHKEEIGLQQALDRKTFEAKEREWRDANGLLQKMVKKLEEKLQSSEKDCEDFSMEKELFYSVRVKQLEQEIEE
jgi:G3E family GTPase